MRATFDAQIYFVGDTHGKWSNVYEALYDLPQDSLVIHVGDAGVGFSNWSPCLISWIGELLKQKNAELWIIRGNHDNPALFKKHTVFHDTIHFLPDYFSCEVNGAKFLFVGGAISIDRCYRRSCVDYWPDEPVVFKQKLCTQADVLVTHSAPQCVPPIDSLRHLKLSVIPSILGTIGFPLSSEELEKLLNDLQKERRDLQKVYELVKPQILVHGHFHRSEVSQIQDCRVYSLAIDEVKPILCPTHRKT